MAKIFNVPYLCFALLLLGINSASTRKIEDIIKVDKGLAKKLDGGEFCDTTMELVPTTSMVLEGFVPTSDVLEQYGQNNNNKRIRTELYEALKNNADKSQRKLIHYLEEAGIKYKAFWITNVVIIFNMGHDSMVDLFAHKDAVEGVKHVKEPVTAKTFPYYQSRDEYFDGEFQQNGQKLCGFSNCSLTWGLKKINAPEAWKISTGKGIVVGHIDTGVSFEHEALRANRREHYSWFSPLPFKQTELPFDDNAHGTHTLGTICGQNGIGVAPGSTWMACKGCGEEGCPAVSLYSYAEFMACPTMPDGSGLDCTKSPDVVSNSWGSDDGLDTFYDDCVAVWRAFGIIPVFANGNAGPECYTAGSPASHDFVIGVGATDENDKIAYFSSRGPSSASFTAGKIKPDISAPGVNVISAKWDTENEYITFRGTSMACPHVAGAVALILSKYPNLSFEEVKKRLQSSAFRPPTAYATCGTSPSEIGEFLDTFPNNNFGYGRLDVLAALTTGKQYRSYAPNFYY